MDGPRTSKVTSHPKGVKASLTTKKRIKQAKRDLEIRARDAKVCAGTVFGVYKACDFHFRNAYIEEPNEFFVKGLRFITVAFFVVMTPCIFWLYRETVPYLIMLYGDKVPHDRIRELSMYGTVLLCCAVAGYSYLGFSHPPSLSDGPVGSESTLSVDQRGRKIISLT